MFCWAEFLNLMFWVLIAVSPAIIVGVIAIILMGPNDGGFGTS
jgi:hypothetical protein